MESAKSNTEADKENVDPLTSVFADKKGAKSRSANLVDLVKELNVTSAASYNFSDIPSV